MEKTDEYFMKEAFKEAQKALNEGEVPIGAIVVLDNKIIGRGYNQVEKLNDATAHAEIIAITSAFNNLGSKYLPEATLYVTLEPCLMCSGALYWSKISRIVYGADDPNNGYKKYISTSLPHPFHPKTIITSGVLKDECLQLIKNFFISKR
ncbi:nucleoside deaminase [soil metagenome]